MHRPSKEINHTFISDYIHLIKGFRIMLDEDLATLYGVPIKRLNEQVKRNKERFPEDFMFRLTSDETAFLRSQFVTLKSGRGKHRKYLPLAFTEQGVAMLSSILRSPRAIQTNIHIMRAFVAMRKYALTHEDLAKKIGELEEKYDQQFAVVFEALRKLIEPPPDPKGKIGFLTEEKAPYIVFS